MAASTAPAAVILADTMETESEVQLKLMSAGVEGSKKKKKNIFLTIK
tara:strand:+ start:10047 stop:10187 length:141 start_codon:yes stop_codon:yes gene_type:complete